MALTSAQVDEAIQKVLISQSYALPDGTVVTRANLEGLRELRRELQISEAQATQGAVFVPIGMGRPS